MDHIQQLRSWRPWSDHPLVVGALLLISLAGVVFGGLTYFATRHAETAVPPPPLPVATGIGTGTTGSVSGSGSSLGTSPTPVAHLPDLLGQSLDSAVVRQLFARLDPHATFSISPGTLFCFQKQGVDLLFDGTLQKLIFYSGLPGDDHLRHERYTASLPFNLTFDLGRQDVWAVLQPHLPQPAQLANRYLRSEIDTFRLPDCRLEVHYRRTGMTESIHSVHLLRSEFAETPPAPEAPGRGAREGVR